MHDEKGSGTRIPKNEARFSLAFIFPFGSVVPIHIAGESTEVRGLLLIREKPSDRTPARM